MRVLVFGAGVLGCNLAAHLLDAGHDVTVLARGDWGRHLRERGLAIHRTLGRDVEGLAVRVVESLAPDDSYDVVFVVVRYSQLDDVFEVLARNASHGVVLVGNNVRPRRCAEALVGKDVLFAFTSCAGRREDGRVYAADLKKIVIGGLAGDPVDEPFVRRVFDGTGYKVELEPHMDAWLLCHAAYVLPMVFACYRAEGDLRSIRKDRGYLRRVVDAQVEGYAAVEAAGFPIRPASDASYGTAGWRRFIYAYFKLLCATPLGKVCVSDHAMNAKDEMRALNRDFKRLFEQTPTAHPAWDEVERSAGGCL